MKIINFIKNIINKTKNKTIDFFIKKPIPVIISRCEHNVSRKNISKAVLKVLYTLKENGFQSYLVGGGIRDLLLEKNPKDFDVVTDAYPEQIKKLFKHCYIIGKRFQLVHVYFNKSLIEVATFRSKHSSVNTKEGMILSDNFYGKIEQDALRRDFTINALYYNIVDYSLVDYVGGLKDLHNNQIRLIGDPITRYREDPVRMLRAVRFAAKLNFHFHKDTEKPIYEIGNLLLNVSSARLYDEYIKLFFTGHPVASFEVLKKYRLTNVLFPSSNLWQLKKNSKHIEKFIICGLNSIKHLENENWISKELQPGYLFAIILWGSFVELAKEYIPSKTAPENFFYKNIADQLLSDQKKIINIPKKIIFMIEDLWFLQLKFSKKLGKPGKKADQIITANRFHMAFNFLLLRVKTGEKKAQKIYAWWNKYLANKQKIVHSK